jgi:hypothetical protein
MIARRAGERCLTAWPDTLTDAVIDAWAAGVSRGELRAQFGLTPGQLAGCGWVSDDVDLCTSCAPRGAP